MELLDLAWNKLKTWNRDHKPWLNHHLIEQGKLLREIFKVYKLSNDEELFVRYQILKKIHHKQILEAKKVYHESLFSPTQNKSKIVGR